VVLLLFSLAGGPTLWAAANDPQHDPRVRILVVVWGALALFAVLVVSIGMLAFLRQFGRWLRRDKLADRQPIVVQPILEDVPIEFGIERVSTLPPDDGERFRRRHRLTRQREYDAVFSGRNSAAGRWIILYGLPNRIGFNRLGLSVGRKYGNAVKRNRFKRLAREAFRLTRKQQPTSWDWIVLPITRPRPGNQGKRRRRFCLAEVEKDMVELMARIVAQEGSGT
jgi:ribonuclease P protein component